MIYFCSWIGSKAELAEGSRPRAISATSYLRFGKSVIRQVGRFIMTYARQTGDNAEMQSTLILTTEQEEQVLQSLSTNECNDCDETRLEEVDSSLTHDIVLAKVPM